MLHLTQRRNKDREKKQTSITVYSNIGVPRVFLNEKELTDIRKGYTNIHYVIDDVTLEMGTNIIRTVVEKNGEVYEDKIEWIYTGEKNREAETLNNREEHSGF